MGYYVRMILTSGVHSDVMDTVEYAKQLVDMLKDAGQDGLIDKVEILDEMRGETD